MPRDVTIQDRIATTIDLLRSRLGVRGRTLADSLRRAKHRLPRAVYAQAMELAQAEQMAEHPRLRLALETPRLIEAANTVQAHLGAINRADRRWGWVLGVLGGLAFNLLLLLGLVLAFAWWRGLF